MRIRSIKPEFWISESIGRLSRDARLLFIGLWSFADDSGRGRGALAMIAGALFPFDADAREKLPGWFAELEREGMVRRYQAEDGNAYFDLPKFLKHQKIDRPSASKIPVFTEQSMTIRRALAEPSPSPRPWSYGAMEQGAMEQGAGNSGAVAPAAGAASPPDPPELALTTEPAKPKRQPATRFTPPTMEELGAYAAEIGLPPHDAAQFYDHYLANGWKVGSNGMKDWKATLRNWQRRRDDPKFSGTNSAPSLDIGGKPVDPAAPYGRTSRGEVITLEMKKLRDARPNNIY